MVEGRWTISDCDADTASPKKIDDSSYENVWKKDGRTTITSSVVVSEDGKTMTITHTGANSKGETVNSTFVYDKK